jgi:hypothetical protein
VSKHEGFAAVVAMRDTALDDLARVLYHAGRIQRRLNATSPAFGTIPALTFHDLVMDPPTLDLQRPGTPHPVPGVVRVGLRLRARGPVTIQAQGIPSERVDSTVELLVVVDARATLVNGRMRIGIDPTSAQLDQLEVTPFDGSSFSPGNAAQLRRADLRAWLAIGLQVVLAQQADLFPPFDISFLGSVVNSPGTQAQLAVDANRLLLGIDATIPASGVVPAVTTTGDITKIRDICGSSDIALVTNPAVLSASFSSIASRISTMATAQGASLASFTVTSVDGHIPVAGRVNHDAGTLDFSLEATPSIGGGTKPSEKSLYISLSDVVVTITPAWWAVLLSVLSLGIVAFIIEFFSSFVRTNIVNGVITQPSTNAGAARRTFTLPGVTDPIIALDVNQFRAYDDGLVVGLLLTPDYRSAKVTGQTQIDIADLAIVHDHPVKFTATLGHDAVAEDPYLRIRWEVRGIDGRSWLVKDGRVRDDGLTLSLVYISLPWLLQAHYRVSCRVYRTRGSASEEILDETLPLSVMDRLDRTRPYVRWVHQTQVPMVTVQPDGSRTELGTKVVTRRSKLHRTAFPGRCKMVSRYSLSWLSAPASVPGPVLEYLDDLPFPQASLASHRGEVCDYCFYGGPTKTVPRSLP